MKFRLCLHDWKYASWRGSQERTCLKCGKVQERLAYEDYYGFGGWTWWKTARRRQK